MRTAIDHSDGARRRVEPALTEAGVRRAQAAVHAGLVVALLLLAGLRQMGAPVGDAREAALIGLLVLVALLIAARGGGRAGRR